MKQKTKIAKYGDSHFIRVPITVMKWFGIESGQEVDMEINNEGEMKVKLLKGSYCGIAIT